VILATDTTFITVNQRGQVHHVAMAAGDLAPIITVGDLEEWLMLPIIHATTDAADTIGPVWIRRGGILRFGPSRYKDHDEAMDAAAAIARARTEHPEWWPA
jgi:hypothetical protein